MSRSVVLSGRFKQLDRAQLRGRLDGREQGTSLSAEDELLSWFQSSLNEIEVSDIERLDLKHFLRNTGQIGLDAGERLRRLAVFLEPNLLAPQPRAWLALDRVYAYAVRLTPESLWLQLSRGISAKLCAQGLHQRDEVTTFRRILKAAWDAGNKAYSIDSQEPDVLYFLGSLAYMDPDRTVGESLQFFDAAIENDPKHQWSLLYRAHCLHDLEHWMDAGYAYSKVDPAFFVGPWAWRYELLLEQKAYCLFRSGDQPTALMQFEMLLNRWISNPKLDLGMVGLHLNEVATGAFRDQLSTRYHELLRNENWAWLGEHIPASIVAAETDSIVPTQRLRLPIQE